NRARPAWDRRVARRADRSRPGIPDGQTLAPRSCSPPSVQRNCSIACPAQKEKPVVASRINRAIELLAQDQAIYYLGAHSGHVLSRAQGREDAGTWADYINVGMEQGAFDMAGLAEYLPGLLACRPSRSRHRTPPLPVQ